MQPFSVDMAVIWLALVLQVKREKKGANGRVEMVRPSNAVPFYLGVHRFPPVENTEKVAKFFSCKTFY